MTANYLTTDDISAALDGEWLLAAADDDQDGIADDAILAEAIADAEAEIDAFCSARYAVPLAAPLPGILRKAGVALAAEALAGRTPALELSEAMEERIRQARALLSSIAQGDLSLKDGREAER